VTQTSSSRAQALPRSTPAEQLLDPAGVIKFLEAVAEEDLELHSLMVLRHGQVLTEGWWAPYAPDQVHLLYSLSKSFTSTALSFAVDEGLVSLDDVALDVFGLDPAGYDPVFGRLTVRHVASMATGHTEDTLERAYLAAIAAAGSPDAPFDLVPALFTVVPDAEPGTVFAYNNGATFLLAAMIQKLAGQGLTEYLRPRLFEPLGIDRAKWALDPLGREMGFSGLHLTTEAIASLGQLYLNGGSFAGRQLLDPGWVDQATSVQVRNDGRDSDPDWECGYGFQFWMARHGYRGDGAYGQFCLVLPEVDGVVAITSATERMQAVLDAAWEHLLPAYLDEPPTGPDRSEELTERLNSLQLPPVRTVIPPADPLQSVRFEAGVDNAAFPALQGFSVTASGVGWLLDLDLDGTRATITAGDGQWKPGQLPGHSGLEVGVQASAGWTADGQFTIELIMIDTPHRVRITGEQGELRTAWNVAPLSASDPTHLGVADTLQRP